MVVIRQSRPSALSCVCSVSAHDIHAGETNLSSMRGPQPWYRISWSETHQAADTPLFLPGKKNEAITHRHKPAKLQTLNLLQKCLSSFQGFFFSPSERPPLPLWDANNNTQGQIPDFKAWNYNCETVTISVTQPLTHSHCVEKSIKPGRKVFGRHMALLKSWQTGGCFQSQLQWDGELLL